MRRARPFLLFFALAFASNCAFYQRYPMPEGRLAKIKTDDLSFYLVDAAHPKTKVWHLSDCRVEPTAVTGFVSRLSEVEASEATYFGSRPEARGRKNDVLIFVKPQFVFSLPDTATMRIPNEQLEKIEVYELNYSKSIGLPLATLTGLLTLLYFITNE
jgi:hypothetical protein